MEADGPSALQLALGTGQQERRHSPNRSLESKPSSKREIEWLVKLAGRCLNFDITVFFSFCPDVQDVCYAPSLPDSMVQQLAGAARIPFDRHGFVGVPMLESRAEFRDLDWMRGDARIASMYGHALATTSGPVGSLCGFFSRAHMLSAEELDDFRHFADLIARELQLSEEAHSDVLTQLWNRRYFERALGSEMSRARRHRIPLQLAIIDIDHFKKINDRLGHEVGDDILVHVASALQGDVHREGDVVARIGGDEFAVLLTETDQASAAALFEAARNAVAALDTASLDTADLSLSISVGFTTYDVRDARTDRQVAQLLKAADEALYVAKRQGRNQVIYGA